MGPAPHPSASTTIIALIVLGALLVLGMLVAVALRVLARARERAVLRGRTRIVTVRGRRSAAMAAAAKRLGDDAPRIPAWFVVAADAGGIEFWGGVLRPRLASTLPWQRVADVEVVHSDRGPASIAFDVLGVDGRERLTVVVAGGSLADQRVAETIVARMRSIRRDALRR